MYAKALMYLFGSGAIGYAILAVATPSQEEIQQIKDIGNSKHRAFSDVLKAAADPKSKPLYLKKDGADTNPFQIETESSKKK